jgi:hypothetical protein
VKLYVGTSRVNRGEGEGTLAGAPEGGTVIGMVDVPDGARVVGTYETEGRLYVEWVRPV